MFEKKISPFTAMIVVCDKKGDDHIGSGVLISANHILTCSHVVDNVKVKGTIVNNKEYTIKNISSNPQLSSSASFLRLNVLSSLN